MYTHTIFGPIHSRRLGTSLGVNLMPNDGKICSFDCLYCEAGYNAQGHGSSGLPSRSQVARLLEQKLAEMHAAGQALDVITFSGNGEPTLHPAFPGIIDDVIALRNRYFPQARVTVLSNSTMLAHREVVNALQRVENCCLKLDSAIDRTIALLDRPTNPNFTAENVIERIAAVGQQVIVQTMITRGSHDGIEVDNSTDTEIEALIEAYRRIRPREIQLYSLDRPTPELSLQKVPRAELDGIAQRITTATGIYVAVVG